MTQEVDFYRMRPDDTLLRDHQVLDVYALAEPGHQYLVFSMDGKPFALAMEPGDYPTVTWIDTKTGNKVKADGISVAEGDAPVAFTCPDISTDWVLVVR